jgi:hypothetical protein
MNDPIGWIQLIVIIFIIAAIVPWVLPQLFRQKPDQPRQEPEQQPAPADPTYDALYVARLIVQKLGERNAATSTPHRYSLSLEIEDLQRLHMHHGYPAVDSPLMDSDDYAALEDPQDAD